jgi:hypothetical protein
MAVIRGWQRPRQEQTAKSKQPKANSQKQTAKSKQPKANSQELTAKSQQLFHISSQK